MTRGLTVGLLLAVAAAAAAQDEVPLDKLRPAQVRARLEKVVAAPATKAQIDAVLKAVPGVTIDPKAVTFRDADGKDAAVFVPGKTKLEWRYTSAAALNPAQDKQVTELMRQVLAEALNQDRDAAGKTLVTTDDWMALSKQVVVARLVAAAAPPPPPPGSNTPPTITLITDKQVMAGDVARVRFTVGDAQTPPADLRVTSVSSNPDVLPPAHQEITPVSPDGSVRELSMVTLSYKPGTVRLTVTVTDAGGLKAERMFLLTIHPVAGTGSGGGTVTPPASVAAPAPVWYGGAGPWYGAGYPAAWPAPYPAVVVGRGYCGCR